MGFLLRRHLDQIAIDQFHAQTVGPEHIQKAMETFLIPP
jgi:hypothetical protein